MKDYIKPTFTLAGLFPVALAAGSDCGIKTSDLENIIGGWGLDVNKVLAPTETCDEKVDIGMYCKFTSVENGSLKVLGS